MDQPQAAQDPAPIKIPPASDDRSADQVMAGVLLWRLMILLVLA